MIGAYVYITVVAISLLCYVVYSISKVNKRVECLFDMVGSIDVSTIDKMAKSTGVDAYDKEIGINPWDDMYDGEER